MYIISILAVILLVVLSMGMTEFGLAGLIYVIDMPSLLFLIVIIVPILCATGLIKDFGKAFVIVSKKTDASLIQMKRSLEAVSLTISVSMVTGILAMLLGVIIVLGQLSDYSMLGPSLAVAVITFVYACMLSIVLLSVKYKLKVKILEFTNR